MTADWTLDVVSIDGTSVLDAGVPFRSAKLTWSLGGAGAIEVSLTPAQVAAADWRAGRRRLVANRLTDAEWAGFLLNLRRDGRPSGIGWSAAGLGLAKVLDRRVVHGGGFVAEDVATEIAWMLIDNAQDQTLGDMGFTQGTQTGSAHSRKRRYCVGDIVAEKINELAAFKSGGFDWEIDQDGAFNTFAPFRGTDLSGSVTLAPADTIDWAVEEDASDLITYVTVSAHSLHADRLRSSSLASEEGRLEEVLTLSHPRNTAELDDAGDDELRARSAASLNLAATWIDGRGPWEWRDVWLGDIVTCELDPEFGGSQPMRCLEVSATLEQQRTFIEYTFMGHDLETESEADEEAEDESFEGSS